MNFEADKEDALPADRSRRSPADVRAIERENALALLPRLKAAG
jgi:hypothetical protein